MQYVLVICHNSENTEIIWRPWRTAKSEASECSESQGRWSPLCNNHHHNQPTQYERRGEDHPQNRPIVERSYLHLQYLGAALDTTQLFQKIFNRKKGEKNNTKNSLQIAKSRPQTQPKK